MIFLGTRTIWIVWIILLLIYLFMAGYVMEEVFSSIKQSAVNPGCALPLDLQIMDVTRDDVMKTFTCMGPDSLSVYKSAEQREDVFYPIVYGLFFSFTVFSLSAYCIKDPRVVVLLTLFSLIMIVFDFLENYFIIQLINQFPNLNDETVMWMSNMNLMKWVTGFTTISLAIILALISLIKALSSRRSVIFTIPVALLFVVFLL